ncbi:unnamed protein product [Microthlaspi erraticum]|uniref:Uncharacterized protein n=1 Tax=Microthlaspi erraticum TaxID=1685480 RepID=A0A6D2I294_9BRAS|nr:unnamed protein product [Microthlaspi erraticum]
MTSEAKYETESFGKETEGSMVMGDDTLDSSKQSRFDAAAFYEAIKPSKFGANGTQTDDDHICRYNLVEETIRRPQNRLCQTPKSRGAKTPWLWKPTGAGQEVICTKRKKKEGREKVFRERKVKL